MIVHVETRCLPVRDENVSVNGPTQVQHLSNFAVSVTETCDDQRMKQGHILQAMHSRILQAMKDRTFQASVKCSGLGLQVHWHRNRQAGSVLLLKRQILAMHLFPIDRWEERYSWRRVCRRMVCMLMMYHRKRHRVCEWRASCARYLDAYCRRTWMQLEGSPKDLRRGCWVADQRRQIGKKNVELTCNRFDCSQEMQNILHLQVEGSREACPSSG